MSVFTTDLNNAQKNLNALADNIVAHNDHIIVRRPDNKNVVIMSEAEFNSWQETVHLLSTDANRQDLAQSLAQADRGQTHTLTPAEMAHLHAQD